MTCEPPDRRAASLDDDAELLRVGRAGRAGAERRGHRGGDADPGVAVLRFEDVREMSWRGEPGRDDRLWRGQLVGAPREVLADHVAVVGVGDVAGLADAVDGRLAAGR